jgi:hypothetical protein
MRVLLLPLLRPLPPALLLLFGTDQDRERC